MKTFTERRRVVESLNRFVPGMEVEDSEVSVSVLVLAWFTFVGVIVHILAFGLFVLWLTN